MKKIKKKLPREVAELNQAVNNMGSMLVGLDSSHAVLTRLFFMKVNEVVEKLNNLLEDKIEKLDLTYFNEVHREFNEYKTRSGFLSEYFKDWVSGMSTEDVKILLEDYERKIEEEKQKYIERLKKPVIFGGDIEKSAESSETG